MQYIDDDGVVITTYQPSELRGGLIWGIRQAYRDISFSRHVIVRLFWRDFIAQFRQKILGYLWAILEPLLGILSFLFLFFVGVLKPGEGEIPYVPYILIGSAIWTCLPGSMGAVSGGLQSQADLILRTRIPKIALAISSLAGVAYTIFTSMLAMLVVMMVIGLKPTWWFLAYPILVLPMVVLGAALGLVLSVLSVIAKDIIPLASQMLSLVMYVTPVIYLQSTIQNPFIKSLIEWNPINYLVDIPRSMIYLGKSEYIDIYLVISLAIILIAIVAVRIFYLLENLVAERL